jgi:hypothetical protein
VSHKSLRKLIEKTVNDIHDGVFYYYGPETDFNQAKKKGFLMVNLAPLQANSTYADNNVLNYSKGWSVSIVFYKFDTEANIRSGEILDEADEILDKFINRINLVDTLTITSMGQTPFIKATADILTGYLLTFTATLNDDFDYCEDC